MNILLLKFLSIFLTSLIAGLLGAIGGSQKYSKLWRRYGIPLISLIPFVLFSWNWIYISFLSLIGVLSIGYGIPDSGDEGSFVGKFWHRITRNYNATEILTRMSISCLKPLAFIAIPITAGIWTPFFFHAFFIVLINTLLGGDSIINKEGSFKWLGTNLLWEEFYIAFFDIFLLTFFIYYI